jgi:hypothetical protein
LSLALATAGINSVPAMNAAATLIGVRLIGDLKTLPPRFCAGVVSIAPARSVWAPEGRHYAP